MYPNRENNYCCGGGGGQLSMGEYSDRRIKAGKIKAETDTENRCQSRCHALS